MPTILGGGALTEGYSISNSMRFGGKGGNAVLQKTFSSDGNRKKFTIATWVKVNAGFMYISGTQTSGKFSLTMFLSKGLSSIKTIESNPIFKTF